MKSATTTPSSNQMSTPVLVTWLLVLVMAVGYGIGGYGLIEPDEGRNAEVGREMAETDNYVLPHLNGLPYLDKPVLFFAAVAASIEVFGANEFAARLAPLLFGLATAAMAGFFAFRFWGHGAAVVAVTAAATAPLALGLSRVVIMDTALSFFVVLAMVSFFFAVESRAGGGTDPPIRWRWYAWTFIAWASMGLGVLTKGPVAFAVPLLVATAYAVWRRAALAVWHPLGPIVMFVVALPWVWAVSREIPDFLHYVVVTETWARMTTDELRRTEPVWFFLPVLVVGAFPWSIVVLTNLFSKRDPAQPSDRRILVYLWLWIVIPLVFFSLSRGKQEQYVLPMVPAIALLVAGSWTSSSRGIRIAAAVWGMIGAAFLVVAGLGVPGLDTSRVPTETAIVFAVAFGAVAVIGFALSWFGVRRRSELGVIGLALPLMAFPALSSGLMTAVASSRSAAGLATEIERRLTPDTELLWIQSYAPGASFYLERTIPVASVDGSELRSNYVLRHSESFFAGDGSLRPVESSYRSLRDCDGPLIILLGARNKELVGAFEEGEAPLLMNNGRWAAFGPACPMFYQNVDQRAVELKVED